jgi:hypothetical protein
MYDENGRISEGVQFQSRRLTRREYQSDAKGQVTHITTYRNGRLLARTRYDYDGLGRVATAVSEGPDGAIVSRLYRYDEHGNPISLVQTHAHRPAQDKIEITAYEYDARGNWTRRTIIRAVNPLDEEGYPFEEPVEVTERAIVYADGSAGQ